MNTDHIASFSVNYLPCGVAGGELDHEVLI